ncbi:G-protein beta WD-40 repeats containing protein [Phytophthora palmivora]|uniref:G-protein beta WD-40 repeats containing protein n=1 Tax=Phytophthora palmivora TaxID=4796 RepID=A0A2P4YLC0_9STRA|nr:G-protein beta WD-40 repeats containing protein [Phytophthora palmivora]
MELLADAAWQYWSKATLTAADSNDRCTVFALQYSDCAVLRVRWNDNSPAKSQFLDPQRDSERDLELHGHAERVVCVKLYDRAVSDVTVCSASRDCVIVWRIASNSRVTQLVLVENLPAEPGWVTFDDTGTLIAVASERDVKIFVIERKEVLVTLEGHLACVTKCEFHPIHHHLLITASEDRTFKIWDVAERALWFQSAVLSAFSILSMAINPVNGDAAFGFADGSVKVFALLDGYAKELTALNVQNFMQKSLRRKQEADREVRRQKPHVISSLPPWARSENAQKSVAGTTTTDSYLSVDNRGLPDPSDNDEDTDVSCPVLSMKYLCVKRPGSRFSDPSKELQFNAHRDRELLDYIQFLAVGVPGFLLSVNAYSFEIRIVHDFQQPLEKMDSVRQIVDPICVAKDICFYHSPQSNVLHCGVTSAFQPCFTMLNATTPSCVNSSNGGNQVPEGNTKEEFTPCEERFTLDNNNERVSVIPRNPPPKDSILNLPPMSAKKTPPKCAKDLDKPVTFHTRIKSSGYGSSSTPFGCRRTPPKSRTISRKSNSEFRAKNVSVTSTSAYLKEYPTSCGLLQHYQPKHALPPKTLHQGAILHIEYSSDAKWVATSGNDRVAQVCKLPFSRFRGEGNVFVGHDQAVRAVHWSQNDQMLVTVGSDKTSRLWLADSDTSSLTLQGLAPPSSVASAATAMGSMSSAKKATRQEIVEAQFFYMDKFLLSACGNLVRLHQFKLDEVYARASSSKTKHKKKNDVEVLENQSRKKRVAQWSFDDMQSVTSLACVNGAFLSSVAVVAGSDRSLRVLDVGAGGGGRTVRVVRDAHGRAAQTVALPRPTCYASHPSNFYDLLLSSAPDSTIHLWDIRADNCVMRFCEHVNRVHTLGVAFSPCMRYVATGSEDRAAYIYDIRTGRRLTKLKGHSDVVTSVAFSPLHPQLATASCDGTVRFYSSEISD